tara:strand:- start:959 stop:2395 length:1437 start_codon:yes stop_codon:yes gene_type:complete
MYKLLFLLMSLLTFGISQDCSPGEYSEYFPLNFPPYICVDCPENTVSNGIDGCYECDSDSIPNADQSDCVLLDYCPSGTYWNGDECHCCPPGAYCPGDNEYHNCPPGKVAGPCSPTCSYCYGGDGWVPDGPRYCEECPAGTYHDGVFEEYSDENCIDCTGNQYSSSPGSTSCSICVDGLFVNDDNTGCIDDCLGEECCTSGLFWNGSECIEYCAAGLAWNGSECQSCTDGFYCSGGCEGPNGLSNWNWELNDCVWMASCPPGTASSPESTSCSECGPGSIPNQGNNHCEDCPEGTYTPDYGFDVCIDCTGNQYSFSLEFGYGGPTSCSICGVGSVVNDDNSECNICPSGYACDGATQTMCEAGTYAPIGSATCIECGSANEYAPPGSSSCQTCDEGYVPNDNSAECVQIPGCTYSSAANYNPDALIDDGSCNSFFTQDDIDNAAIEAYIEGAQSGDINGSGHLNITDIIMYIDKILTD